MTEQRKDRLALIHHNYTYHVIITGMRHFKVRQTALFLFDGGNEIGINIILATGICFY